MKIIKEGKLFGKINLIDVCVILMILVLAYNVMCSYEVITGKLAFGREPSEETYEQFTFSIKIEKVNAKTGEMFKKGDTVFDGTSGTSIGRIINIEINEAQDVYINENGTAVSKSVPGKVDIILDVLATGKVNNGEYVANGLIKILVGENKKIKTKYVSCLSSVINIEKVEN